MKYLKAFIMVVFGLKDEPTTGNVIGVIIGLIFICMMLILASGVFG